MMNSKDVFQETDAPVPPLVVSQAVDVDGEANPAGRALVKRPTMSKSLVLSIPN